MLEQMREQMRIDNEQQRADMRENFASLRTQMAQMVTQEAFRAEQQRRDEQYASLSQDIVEKYAAQVTSLNAEQRDRRQGDKDQQIQLDGFKRWLWSLAIALLLPIALFLGQAYLARSS